MNADRIPVELIERDQWVVWRREARDGKATKVPYDAKTGGRASTTDPATWTSFDHAAGMAGMGADGVGYVFSPGDPFCGVDLDDCVDSGGELHPEAQRIVDALDSYTERSPSGAGVHIIVRAELNGGRNRTSKTGWAGEFESYDRARYFCMTGDVLRDVPVADRQAGHAELMAGMFPAAKPLAPAATTVAVEDDEVCARARAAANATKFERLWEGDTAGYGSASEADLALCSIIAFHTRDVGQIDRLFRGSGLMREKWDRGDYRDATIAKALEPAPVVGGEVPPARLPFRSLAEIVADIPEEPAWIVPGFIAPSTETLLVGPPKVGKSTLLFRLLAGLEGDGRALGLDVRRVSYLLLTEENVFTLQEKMFDFDLRGRGGEALLFQEARAVTWMEVMQESVARCKEKGHELLIVDTFSRWAGMGGEAENSAGSVQEAWQPFGLAKDAGLATTVLHHTRKSGGAHGEGIRGSNAIAALPDILLELARTGREDPAARVLNANSRYRSTPEVLGLVYTGTDYEVTTDVGGLRRPPRRQEVFDLLAAGPSTRKQVAEQLGVQVNAAVAHLNKLVESGDAYHTGAGTADDPYIYHQQGRD